MCRIAEEGERRHQRLRRRRWLPEYSRSTLPFPLSVDWSMPSALPRTLPTTAKSSLRPLPLRNIWNLPTPGISTANLSFRSERGRKYFCLTMRFLSMRP
ncbi:hypothetical protein Pyn_15302 [Prunus yedoensis var. nudiflora]|uniref:Uncharacterized protein n=1 Tax=Prunus yedoensis var. nudiflora TaxID=2094558 RepID=A0A314XFU5_PRUYE|nr:hypothetical protein Pyn_15302 [Prunus yedoensis var. nudiflora]